MPSVPNRCSGSCPTHPAKSPAWSSSRSAAVAAFVRWLKAGTSRRCFRSSRGCECATKGIGQPHSEVRFGLYQELHAADAASRLKGERQIDVHHVAQTRASITEAQPEARVLEKPETRLSQWRGPPCASRVEENGAADTEQPERIPVGEVSLLHT